MPQSIKYIYSTIKGSKHKENEDNLLIIDHMKFCLFVVFDGVSSALSGKEATDFSKKFIEENYQNYIRGNVQISLLMYDLNLYLCSLNLEEPYSTYSLVYYNKGEKSIYYSWLGDSRIYIVTNQFIEQLTQDDSYSENIVTKYLGDATLTFEDFRQIEKKKIIGNILLCTDGFYKLLENNRIRFFDSFLKKRLAAIEGDVNNLINGRNSDDSTFIFVR